MDEGWGARRASKADPCPPRAEPALPLAAVQSERGARGWAVEDRGRVGVEGEERRVWEDRFGEACWSVGTMRRGVAAWMDRFGLI